MSQITDEMLIASMEKSLKKAKGDAARLGMEKNLRSAKKWISPDWNKEIAFMCKFGTTDSKKTVEEEEEDEEDDACIDNDNDGAQLSVDDDLDPTNAAADALACMVPADDVVHASAMMPIADGTLIHRATLASRLSKAVVGNYLTIVSAEFGIHGNPISIHCSNSSHVEFTQPLCFHLPPVLAFNGSLAKCRL